MQPGYLIYALKQLEATLRPKLTQICVDHGLSVAQYTVLTVLNGRPGLTSSELARRSFVTAQTMAGTVEPLLQRGLVTREPDPSHARRMRLSLTDKGRFLVSEVAPAVTALEDQLVHSLDETERVTLSELLRRCRHDLEQAVPTPATGVAS